MTEDQAAKVLLVRAVEESNPNLFRDQDLRNAYERAGTEFGEQNWFLSRAAYLMGTLPTGYLSILEMAKLPGRWLPGICVLTFLSGIAANYLGPPGKIHVLFNPIVLLAAWNLFIYFMMVVRYLIATRRPARDGDPANEARDRSKSLPWGLKHLLPPVWRLTHGLSTASAGAGFKASYAHVATRFWLLWSGIAGSMILSQWRRMRHLIAVSLALGAIAGIYLRGLFFDYNVIWTSTFIKSQEAVSRAIELTLAPALWLGRFFGREPDLNLLVGPEGAPAAEWIHMYAITALLVVIVPRLTMATWETRHAGVGHDNLRLYFDEYYTDRVEPQLKSIIEREVRSAVATFAQQVAGFAAEKLYEDQIVPEVNRFRREGGKISALKQTIEAHCVDFQPALNTYVREALGDFERSLAASIARVAKDLEPDLPLRDMTDSLWSHQGHTDQITATVSPMGRSFADVINTVVSLSAAATAATISGGLGESLGIALLVELTAVSGPVGFIIGGITALVVTATGLWLGREKITGAIESIRIPGVALRGVLWSAKYERLLAEGKAKTRESVEQRMGELMAPAAPKIADSIWLEIEKVWRLSHSAREN